MQSIRKFRRAVSIIIAAQLSFPDPLFAQNSRTTGDPSPGGQNLVLDSNQRAFLTAAQAIEEGRIPESPINQYDTFRIAGQFMEILDSRRNQETIQLDDLGARSPNLSYTNIRSYYDRNKRSLVFEATRGENRQGQHGTPVARQYIPNLDIVAMAEDLELLSFVDTSGRLHVVDMGYAREQLFKGPIPVFQNVWEPRSPVDLSKLKVRAEYMTRGMGPRDLDNSLNEAVLPLNSEGKPLYTAGDLLVQIDSVKGSQTTYGIFSRKVTHQRVAIGSQVLQFLCRMVAENPDDLSGLKTVLDDLKTFDDRVSVELNLQTMPSLIRDTLSTFSGQQLAALSDRHTKNLASSNRRADIFDAGDLEQFHIEFTGALEYAVEKAKREKSRIPTLANDWQTFVSSQNKMSDAPKPSVLSKLGQRVQNPKFLAALLGGSAVAYLGLPFAVDAGLVDNIKVVSWLYENAYPAVLKDTEYRNPLILSMTSLMAFWPIAVGLASGAKSALKGLGKAFHSSTTPLAAKARDWERSWTELSTWQVITSFGMRVYSYLIYPYYKAIIKTALRQKSFMSAIESGLNPFERISPDSELGELLGLRSSQWVGINSPFLSPSKLSENSRTKDKIQALEVEIRQRKKSLAWTLAAMVLSVESDVDPATILALGPQGFSREKLESLLHDPQKQSEWHVLADMIYKDLSTIRAANIAGGLKLDNQEIRTAYEAGKKRLTQMKSLSKFRLYTRDLSLRFKRRLLALGVAASQFGEKDANFLRTVKTGDFVSEQVKREFVTDHSMVVGIYGLVGDRANLNDPTNLSASPNGPLWTSPPHFYDLAINTWIHFFVQGSRLALVFQGVSAKEELKYLPVEDFSMTPVLRQQGLLSTALQWTREVLNPFKADLGGLMIRRLRKTLTTLQAGLTMNVLMRCFVTDQSLSTALSAFVFMYATAQWYFGWVWDPIQRGNQLQGERFNGLEQEVKAARSDIAQGLRMSSEMGGPLVASGYSKLKDLFEKHNPKALNDAETKAGRSLNATELLGLSVLDSPVYTEPHPFITWFTSWTGAVGSTYLAIPFSVNSFNPEYLAPESLFKWTVVSAALYTGAYFLLGKAPWEFYREKIRSFFEFEKLGPTPTNKRCDEILSGSKESSQVGSRDDAA